MAQAFVTHWQKVANIRIVATSFPLLAIAILRV